MTKEEVDIKKDINPKWAVPDDPSDDVENGVPSGNDGEGNPDDDAPGSNAPREVEL